MIGLRHHGKKLVPLKKALERRIVGWENSDYLGITIFDIWVQRCHLRRVG